MPAVCFGSMPCGGKLCFNRFSERGAVTGGVISRRNCIDTKGFSGTGWAIHVRFSGVVGRNVSPVESCDSAWGLTCRHRDARAGLEVETRFVGQSGRRATAMPLPPSALPQAEGEDFRRDDVTVIPGRRGHARQCSRLPGNRVTSWTYSREDELCRVCRPGEVAVDPAASCRRPDASLRAAIVSTRAARGLRDRRRRVQECSAAPQSGQ